MSTHRSLNSKTLFYCKIMFSSFLLLLVFFRHRPKSASVFVNLVVCQMNTLTNVVCQTMKIRCRRQGLKCSDRVNLLIYFQMLFNLNFTNKIQKQLLVWKKSVEKMETVSIESIEIQLIWTISLTFLPSRPVTSNDIIDE